MLRIFFKTKPLKILITNIILSGYSGTETVVRDLAIGFSKLGHKAMVYSPEIGGVSEQIRAAGITIVTELSQLESFKPDIIHGHHHIQTLEAIKYFPDVPAIFVCHSDHSWHDIPPKHKNILSYAAVDRYCQDRMVQHYHFVINKCRLIYNWFDESRFTQARVLNVKPKNALVFSSYARDNHTLATIRTACENYGLKFDVLGYGIGKGTDKPETVIDNYDIIFAKAKCAIEAIAMGAAVIVCDTRGLGGLVTTDNLAEYRSWNFGLKLMTKQITVANITRELKKYSASDAKQVTKFMRKKATLSKSLRYYIYLYQDVIKKWMASTNHKVNKAAAEIYDLDRRYLLEIASRYEAICKQDFIMHRLTQEQASRLTFEPVYIPKSAKLKTCIQCRVNLTNDTDIFLASCLPYPIYFSYHWLAGDATTMYFFEGDRSPIEGQLEAGQTGEYIVEVVPPGETGEFYLLLTMVQDHYTWLNELNPLLQAKAKVEIFSEGSLA